jgi:hypothetical protein
VIVKASGLVLAVVEVKVEGISGLGNHFSKREDWPAAQSLRVGIRLLARYFDAGLEVVGVGLLQRVFLHCRVDGSISVVWDIAQLFGRRLVQQVYVAKIVSEVSCANPLQS